MRSIAGAALDRVAEHADPVRALETFAPPPAAAECWSALVDAFRVVRGGAAGWPAKLDAVRAWYEPHLERIPRGRRGG